MTTNLNKEDGKFLDLEELAEQAKEVEKLEKGYKNLGIMEIESAKMRWLYLWRTQWNNWERRIAKRLLVATRRDVYWLVYWLVVWQ